MHMQRSLLTLLTAALCCGAASPSIAQGPDPAPFRIETVRSSASGTSLTWSDAGSAADYSVQVRQRVPDGIWIVPRTQMPWPISSREWLDVYNAGAPAFFYRVVAVPRSERGKLLAHTEIRSLAAWSINLMLAALDVPLTVQYDVRVYKLLYETVDPLGGRTVASGALALPQNPGHALPLCSYQHGTIAKRSEAPSAANSNEQLLGVVMAASGYATVLPDYLGLGDSLLAHPYHHAASEATASVDMLRAARALCSSRSVALSGQLFLIGYSHGGHATMALHRELEEYHAGEFSLTASAPMAGAYDLSGVTTDDVLGGRPMPNPYYFAMLLSSYQAVYRLADSLADILAPPYDATLPPLLDGEHSGGEINAAMPDDVTEVLKPEYVAALRSQPDHPLRLALRDNDLYRWTPRSPMRMYHCRGDGDVLYANSQVAHESFLARGATQVQLVDPNPSAGHGDCSIPSLLLAKKWFDTLRQ